MSIFHGRPSLPRADDSTIGDITRNGRCRHRRQFEGIADSRK